MDEQTKKLEARIVELEQKLSAVPRRAEPAQISAEEVQAFHKVRDMIAADWGGFCGINDCYRPFCLPCYRCIGGGGACLCIRNCIHECVCGPCASIAGGLGGQGGGGFGGFGG